MEWQFCYTRDGEKNDGFASMGEPQKDKTGENWEVQIECDLHSSLRPIVGVSPEGSMELGLSFLKQLYADLNLRKPDGSPFDWEDKPQP